MIEVVGQSLGQYKVMELIGTGGMARVYKGYQSSLARFVAIKAISSHVDNERDNTFLQRFTTEARVIARLTHPNIVPVHDYGEDKGWAFIVMEYIAGGTLRDRIVRADQQRQRLDLAPTLERRGAPGCETRQHAAAHRGPPVALGLRHRGDP